MANECMGCFAYHNGVCTALENTVFPYPCPFRKEKVTKKPIIERTCSNCFFNSGEWNSECAILIEKYKKNCPFHKTRYEYEKGLNK